MEEINALATLSRLMQATGASNESALAAILNVSSQAVYQARKKQRIPPSWVISVAESHKINSDWLFFGRGPMRLEGGYGRAEAGGMVRADILSDVVETLEEYLLVNRKMLPPGAKAEIVRDLCAMVAASAAPGPTRPARMLRLIHDAVEEKLETAGHGDQPRHKAHLPPALK